MQKGEIIVQFNLNDYNLVANSIFFALPDSLCELQCISADLSITCVAFRKDYIEKQGLYRPSLELSQPAMNVARAASIMEFSNQSFFGKYFKHHTRLSPAEYRKNSHLRKSTFLTNIPHIQTF